VASDLGQEWEIRTHGVDGHRDDAMVPAKLGGRKLVEEEDIGSGEVGQVGVVAEHSSAEEHVHWTKTQTQVECAWGQAAHDPSSIKASQPANALVNMKRNRRSSGQYQKIRHRPSDQNSGGETRAGVTYNDVAGDALGLKY
jgi:hypothetical protein